jgi:hypothetical protein
MHAEELPVLRQQESNIQKDLVRIAIDLSAARRVASTHLRHAVEGCLKELAMEQSRFDVRIGWELQEGAPEGGGAGVATLHVGEAANMIGAHLRAHVWLLLLRSCHCSNRAKCVPVSLLKGTFQFACFAHVTLQHTLRILREGPPRRPIYKPSHEHGTGEEPQQAYSVAEAGLDRVEFLLAAGPSEPLRPLRTVASGGESARIMLALKASPKIALAAGAVPTPSCMTASLRAFLTAGLIVVVFVPGYLVVWQRSQWHTQLHYACASFLRLAKR